MIFSDLPSPAEALFQAANGSAGFAQAGNRYPPRIGSGAGFFGIMRYAPRIGGWNASPVSHGKWIHVSCDTSVMKVSTMGRPFGLA